MKRIIVVLLALVSIFVLAGCGNDIAEENEVMSYLTRYGWYTEIQGTDGFSMLELYLFDKDGTYTYSDQTLLNGFALPGDPYRSTGTFAINTNKKTIILTTDENKKLEFTYSLYSTGLKMYKYSREYQSITKEE